MGSVSRPGFFFIHSEKLQSDLNRALLFAWMRGVMFGKGGSVEARIKPDVLNSHRHVKDFPAFSIYSGRDCRMLKKKPETHHHFVMVRENPAFSDRPSDLKKE